MRNVLLQLYTDSQTERLTLYRRYLQPRRAYYLWIARVLLFISMIVKVVHCGALRVLTVRIPLLRRGIADTSWIVRNIT